MEQLTAGMAVAYLDFMILGPLNEPLIVSYFERSAQVVRAVGATLVMDGILSHRYRTYKNGNKFSVNYVTIQNNKEKFIHGIAVAKNLTTDYLVTTKADLYNDLYYLLMNTFDLPLLEWWMPELFAEMEKKGVLYHVRNNQIYGNRERKIKKNNKEVSIKDLVVYKLIMNEDSLKNLITSMFKKKCIWITRKPQKELKIENLDDYFQNYGKSIVDNLNAILEPISQLNGKLDRVVLKEKRLYPQQAAMSNGVYEYFRKTKSKNALFVMGTGSGKTIQAAVTAEMLYVGKWLEQFPDKTLTDAYMEDGIINYRHIITCPGHLVKKWEKELEKEIPYAKPVVVDSFSQLVKLRAAGKERVSGKEFYIISKDFLKLSYQRIPTPNKQGSRRVNVFKCKDCGTIQRQRTDKCVSCQSEKIQIVKTKYIREGLICPSCNRLVFPSNFKFDMEDFEEQENIHSQPLRWFDMSAEKNNNQNCIYCGESLWMPFIKNVSTEFGYERQPAWIRQTFWTSKAKKRKVTNWVLRGYEDKAKERYGQVLNSMENSTGGCRKYSPALYIKKELKGYFDVFICDEIHEMKGSSTAQANASHQIMKASKYTIGLTGTIAGGYATDLFYILFRFDPKRMMEHGYTWDSEMKFAQDYGCVETEYTASPDVRRNVCSRGKKIGQPKMLPGISPLIFSEFLLDKAVFLNIEDMSANMPPLYEIVRLCNPESELEKSMHINYNRVLKMLKEYGSNYEVNLTSIGNQFAMSYLDKPYDADAILDPRTGDVVALPNDYRVLIEDNKLLAKEKLLVEIVNQELKEGRNCVVYCEYTQSESTNVLPRLHEILVKNCGLKSNEVVIMRAGYPAAVEREMWMHKKAEEGMKILLCNPRLCQTGLDFCWEERGVIYNYPTLIFFQSGYSLFVMWQAAGRAWRLNQREECRTYYLAYEKTVQQAILQVLGEKKAATSAIQGKFSADGLAAMAKGVDTQVRIAQIMSNIDHQTGNELQKMFDVITAEKDSAFDDGPTMKLFSELIVKAQEKEESLGFERGTLFDLFTEQLPSDYADNSISLFSVMSQFDQFILIADENVAGHEIMKKRKRKEKVYEDCSLF